MTDKEKRLRKILVKKCLKGKLKSVGSIEEARVVIVENKQCIDRTLLVGKDTYRQLLEEGYSYPEDQVHYLVSTNPRNAWHIERQFMSNSYGSVKSKPI